jgi:hypothetical protein
MESYLEDAEKIGRKKTGLEALQYQISGHAVMTHRPHHLDITVVSSSCVKSMFKDHIKDKLFYIRNKCYEYATVDFGVYPIGAEIQRCHSRSLICISSTDNASAIESYTDIAPG